VEDGTCICPARIDANTWLNFMCHNLGGIDIISPSQVITYKHHGNWYRFGAKNSSVVNTGENIGAVTGWTSNVVGAWPPYYAYGNGTVTPGAVLLNNPRTIVYELPIKVS
jgi:hypothetical protein